jgi:hypothetical protein
MDYIMINSDKWEDAGKHYRLVSLYRRPESTATELVLEYNGETVSKVVPYHSIEWIKE